LIWTGGNRGKKDPYNGNNIEDTQDRYGIQYKEYFRIDMSMIYRINKSRVSHILSLDIQNLTNRENQVSLKTSQTGIAPFLSYKIEF
jgi:hypothetical protein